MVGPWAGVRGARRELAEEALRASLSLRESSNQYIFLCAVLDAKGDPFGALHCCKRAIQLRPKHADASLKAEDYLNLGLTFVAMKSYRKASKAFERALELDPEEPRALCNLGIMSFRRGDLKAAEQLLRRATKRPKHLAKEDRFLAPVFAQNHAYLAMTLESQGRIDDARREVKAAIRWGRDDRWINKRYEEFRNRTEKDRGT
jgi:tetratricopeptide (TPR) repeat protein